jgi:hypothetical protein
MQTRVREAPGPAVTTDLELPNGRGLAGAACKGAALLLVLVGGPVLAAGAGWVLLAIVVAAALLVAMIALIWRVGLEFERAWLGADAWSMLEDGRGPEEKCVHGDVYRSPMRPSAHAGR